MASPKSKATPKPATQQSTFTQPSLKFLNRSHKAVRSHFASTTELPEFLATAGELSLGDRQRLVEQALLLIEANYVHLPLKAAMHGVNPVQRLRLIQHRLDQADPARPGSEFAFHRELLEVFNSLRDLHTNYLLPAPFNAAAAFMPFDIEEYFDAPGSAPRYIASHFVEGFSHRHFQPGVEITLWNGVPIQRAIALNGDRHAGSNLPARHVRGIDGLTIRPLQASLPPDELWVIISYIDLDGEAHEMRQDWLVVGIPEDANAIDTGSVSPTAASLGIDLQAELVSRMKKLLFAPRVIAQEAIAHREITPKTLDPDASQPQPSPVGEDQEAPLTSSFPGVFSAKAVDTTAGQFGYIRIYTFAVEDPEAFVEEFIRLVEQLPQSGLIIDVRGNGGGHIWASEGLLQLLTPREIEAEPVQFINTPLNLRICDRHGANPLGIDLGPWVASMGDAVETGAVYSQSFSITPAAFANDWGQRYYGPVVLITDARCYSATDIFAAGFQDHAIGPILGVDDNTGAGGANVWTHQLLDALLRFPEPPDPDSPYAELPQGADLRVSIRRTLRVGDRAGTPVEDLGIQPDERHYMTENDLLNGNADLIGRAGELLAALPVRQLAVTTQRSGARLVIEAETMGLSRLDIYIDGRPVDSQDVTDGRQTFEVQLKSETNLLKLVGFDGEQQVATRKLKP